MGGGLEEGVTLCVSLSLRWLNWSKALLATDELMMMMMMPLRFKEMAVMFKP